MCCGDWSELCSAARRRLLRGAGTCRLLALIIGLSGSLSLTVCAQVPEPVELPTAQPLGVPEIETPATDPQPEIPAADSATEAPADPLSPAAQQKWLDQLQRFDPALAQQKLTAGQVPQDPQQQRVQFFIETPHLGQVYVSGPSARPYFAAKLTVLNLTPDPVVIKREQVTFTINGQKLELKEVPPDIKFYGVEIDQQHYQLGQLNPFLTVQIPPGGIRSDWIFATQFPTQGAIPKIEVQIQQGETPVKLDVNQLQRSLLSLETAQLGPRNCLTVLRISGELNIINLGGMIDELDRTLRAG